MSAGTRPASMCCQRTARRRPHISTRRSSRNISRIARRSGAANEARRRGSSAAPAKSFRIPRSIHETEVWRWYLVDKSAPAEVKDFLRDYYIRYSGPGGMTEQDDMENWNYAHAASRGTIA